MSIEHVTDPGDPRVREYLHLTDMALRKRVEPAHGIYLAESAAVIRRALGAGHEPISYLMAERWLEGLADLVVDAERRGTPVYVGDRQVLAEITGFHLHRGAIAAMHRPAPRDPFEVVRSARRVVVPEDVVDRTNVSGHERPPFSSRTRTRSRIAIFENIVDHTNLGAAFRSAAAIGVDAVLVTPRCADPLYRRSIRVSMGTVFQVPWARIDSWPADIDLVKEHGYLVAGMTLGEGAITLDELAAEDHPQLALVFGTEGHGLSRQADRRLDRRVTIPMMHGVDSLNVAASAAVAFYATR